MMLKAAAGKIVLPLFKTDMEANKPGGDADARRRARVGRAGQSRRANSLVARRLRR